MVLPAPTLLEGSVWTGSALEITILLYYSYGYGEKLIEVCGFRNIDIMTINHEVGRRETYNNVVRMFGGRGSWLGKHLSTASISVSDPGGHRRLFTPTIG